MKEEALPCAFKKESDFKGWRGQRGERTGVGFGVLGLLNSSTSWKHIVCGGGG